uniref:Chemokine interleukin-8-like domain-containing protein n=1 Tax=Denticeps clupeoides TaxID=299321 RepID=A0AAY3ZXC3_9TELE
MHVYGMLVRTLALVAIIAPLTCGKTGLSCCTTVSNAEISDPIISFSYQKDNGFECVNSVILTTERGPFCINPRARWLLPKIREFLIQQDSVHHYSDAECPD